ncbi:aminoglycoside phosphotransferase [Haloechinothrix sp. LS1_15]|uniref:aminoglycoside phosphotransferase n=1 Tax=Haloechinothrix sp. LS1_15 TaxID=2652248 RepID=UPI00294B8195|nr:aminoglycoside phosphotransferase [Haloechinothrix sp. LS1_15]
MTAGEGSPEADRRYREWMRELLDRAARRFRVTLDGPAVFGWRDRSLGAPVRAGEHPRWLRVVTEAPRWADGLMWTGNLDANDLEGLAKPRVLDVVEWRDNPARHVRAELMTQLAGTPCSPDPVAGPDLALDEGWWSQLTGFLRDLSCAPTSRVNADQPRVDHRVDAAFGPGVTVAVDRWETVHGDLHWANLHREPFGVLDWEGWGRGPVGTDAATLYLYSLAAPNIAAAVHRHFSDVLDSPTGRTAQLFVTARLLYRATLGDHPQLITPLRARAHSLLVDSGKISPDTRFG